MNKILLHSLLITLFSSFPVPGVAEQTDPIGRVEEATGVVRAGEPQARKRRLADGDPLYPGEELTTGPLAFLRIELLDKTVFVLGANSRLLLDEMAYHSESGRGKIDFFASGVFRFKSGKIVETDPEKMKVRMPVAVIGVRGTQVAAEAKETESLVVLEEIENENKPQKHVVIQNQVNDQIKESSIEKAGDGVRVQKGKAPGKSFRVPKNEMERLQNKLKNPDEGPDGDGFGGGLGGGTGSRSSSMARDMQIGDFGDSDSFSGSQDRDLESHW